MRQYQARFAYVLVLRVKYAMRLVPAVEHAGQLYQICTYMMHFSAFRRSFDDHRELPQLPLQRPLLFGGKFGQIGVQIGRIPTHTFKGFALQTLAPGVAILDVIDRVFQRFLLARSRSKSKCAL